MTPAAIIQAAAADGVRLALTESGALKTIGHPDSVQQWLPRLREHKAEIVQLLAAANDPTAAPAKHWWIHFPDRDPVEVYLSPPVTHAEVLAQYGGAVAAEPIRQQINIRPATPQERTELLALIQGVFADDTDADRAEALDAALADPAGALTCYRGIAAERGITVERADARQSSAQSARQSVQQSVQQSAARNCSTCRHRTRPGLSAGYCSGRDDLAGAYGAHHPLRQLPADQGATCASYQSHE